MKSKIEFEESMYCEGHPANYGHNLIKMIKEIEMQIKPLGKTISDVDFDITSAGSDAWVNVRAVVK